jgi:threonine dehydrogenase-like Zn-dependent dehydrogenase
MSALVAASDQGGQYRQVQRPLADLGQVVLRVDCAGVCRTDIYAADGQIEVAEGRVLGHEFCGTVVGLGPGVNDALFGQRFAVFPWLGCGRCGTCKTGLEGPARCAQRRQLGVDLDGAFAEEVVVPADRLLAMPATLESRAAAYAEPVAAALGVENLVPPGACVGLFGGNRIASLNGRLLKHLGRVPCSGEEAKEETLEWALEASASPATLERAMRALCLGGTLLVKSRPAATVAWPLRLQVEKELRVIGCGYGSFAQAVELLDQRPDLFCDLWEEPVPLRQWREVFARERAGDEGRKAFFCPDPWE